MKFKAPVSVLYDVMNRVADICAKNTTNQDDLSKYVLMELTKGSLTVTGTDNNVQLSATIPLDEGSCEQEGTILFLASKAKEFFKGVDKNSELSFSLDDSQELLNVTNGAVNSVIRVRKLGGDLQFPSFQSPEDGSYKSFTLASNVLKRLIEKSSFCVSTENFRDYLKGLRMEVEDNLISVFALDGHRMAALDAELKESCPEPIKFLMTLRGVQELSKLLKLAGEDITIDTTDEFMRTSIGIYTMYNRLLKCKYPNVRNVIPAKCSPVIGVNCKELDSLVSRVAMFSNKRLNHVQLLFTTNNLHLMSQNSDSESGKADMFIEYSEPDFRMEINLNARFLRDFLRVIDTEQVFFGFAPPYSNTVIRPASERDEFGVRISYVVSHILV